MTFQSTEQEPLDKAGPEPSSSTYHTDSESRDTAQLQEVHEMRAWKPQGPRGDSYWKMVWWLFQQSSPSIQPWVTFVFGGISKPKGFMGCWHELTVLADLSLV